MCRGVEGIGSKLSRLFFFFFFFFWHQSSPLDDGAFWQWDIFRLWFPGGGVFGFCYALKALLSFWPGEAQYYCEGGKTPPQTYIPYIRHQHLSIHPSIHHGSMVAWDHSEWVGLGSSLGPSGHFYH